MSGNNGLFSRIQVLCNILPKDMEVKLYAHIEDVEVSTTLSYFQDIGGSQIVLSNIMKSDRVFNCGEFASILNNIDKNVGGHTDDIDIALEIWMIPSDNKFQMICNRIVETIEVDTINKIIYLTDGSIPSL